MASLILGEFGFDTANNNLKHLVVKDRNQNSQMIIVELVTSWRIGVSILFIIS